MDYLTLDDVDVFETQGSDLPVMNIELIKEGSDFFLATKAAGVELFRRPLIDGQVADYTVEQYRIMMGAV